LVDNSNEAAHGTEVLPVENNAKPNAPGELPNFAHPSEEEFARILDFYGLDWKYEPRSFPLRWEGDKVVEMFTPDFYLSELGMFVELTTMKQSLVTAKNRKIRFMKELYPDVNVRLLYRKDYHRILAKYGFGPLAQADVQGIDRVLFTSNQIQRRVAELGKQISHDYRDKPPVLVGVLRGMICFMADLMREITLPVEIEVMAISRYQGEDKQGVKVTKDLDSDIAGRDVILVEDIVDSGMTLYYLLRYLWSKQPSSVEVCAFLDKRVRRIVEIPVRYTGFEVPDEFVVGYGLDYEEKYRNLPFIGSLQPEAKE
jgi:hypoxanthine phosphoribosyltransferase